MVEYSRRSTTMRVSRRFKEVVREFKEIAGVDTDVDATELIAELVGDIRGRKKRRSLF